MSRLRDWVTNHADADTLTVGEWSENDDGSMVVRVRGTTDTRYVFGANLPPWIIVESSRLVAYLITTPKLNGRVLTLRDAG